MASIRTNVMCVLFAGAAVAAACGGSDRNFGPSGDAGGASGETGEAGDTSGDGGRDGSGGSEVAGGAGTTGASGGATGQGGGAGTPAGGGSGGSTTGGSGGAVTAGAGGTAGEAGSPGAGGTAGEAGSPGAGGSAGEAGSPGAGGTAGEAGSPGAGGTAGEAGSPGVGGTAGVAGQPGSGGSGGGCTVTGIEANFPNDGIDNDCNGNIDIPVLTEAFPEMGKAAAGVDVKLTFQAPALPNAVFQCRRFKPGTNPLPAFGTCDTDGQWLSVEPFTAAQSQDPGQDGLWQTEVRIAFPDGVFSDVLPYRYYTHSSMHGVRRCEPRAVDQAYFEAAGRLVVNGMATFGPADVALANPFIHIEFAPSLNNRLAVSYDNVDNEGRGPVLAGDGVADVLSLRKRFILSGDGSLLLMTRVYEGRRTRTCTAGSIKTHDQGIYGDYDPNRFYVDRCDAMVWNRHGAGECLYVDSDGNVQLNTTHQLWLTGTAPNQSQHPLPYPDAGQFPYFAGPDNFMWRKLVRTGPANGEPYRQLELFSPKCDVAGCQAGNAALYLPDHELF